MPRRRGKIVVHIIKKTFIPNMMYILRYKSRSINKLLKYFGLAEEQPKTAKLKALKTAKPTLIQF